MTDPTKIMANRPITGIPTWQEAWEAFDSDQQVTTQTKKGAGIAEVFPRDVLMQAATVDAPSDKFKVSSVKETQRPQLTPPKTSYTDTDTHVEIESLDLSDGVLMQRFYSALATHRDNLYFNKYLDQTILSKEQEIQKIKYKQTCEKQDKIMEADTGTSITGWIGMALQIGLFVASLATLALAFISAGALLPAAVAASQGVLSLGTGVNSIVGGHYKNQSNQNTSEFLKLREERDLSHNRGDEALASTGVITGQIEVLNKMQREAADNFHEAVVAIYRG
jgi:hypothetical protein